MKKKRSLSRRKNTFEKKISIEFFPGHPSSELTRQGDQFTPDQLQTQILNETDSVNTIESY